MVADGVQAWSVLGQELLAWSPSGYGDRRAATPSPTLMALKPPSLIVVIPKGYRPGLHPSAGQGQS